MHNASMEGSRRLNNNLRGKSEKQKSSISDGHENTSDDYKKMMHRDLERQRRQEMAALYASLRTLLPLEYIKGKRAVSDHMNGAVSYIKDLQQGITQLSEKRDQLKKLSDLSVVTGETSSHNSIPSCITVHQCPGGIEVVISTALGLEALALSRVLAVLLDQGLDVASCVSTRVNERLLHTIQVEARDLTSFDMSGLQQKLMDQDIPLWSRISL